MHNNAPQSVGLLWMSDQLIAEISTLKHTIFTIDRMATGTDSHVVTCTHIEKAIPADNPQSYEHNYK
jgi:hypothetical protein